MLSKVFLKFALILTHSFLVMELQLTSSQAVANKYTRRRSLRKVDCIVKIIESKTRAILLARTFDRIFLNSVDKADWSEVFDLMGSFFFRDETNKGVVNWVSREYAILKISENLEDILLNSFPKGLVEDE